MLIADGDMLMFWLNERTIANKMLRNDKTAAD